MTGNRCLPVALHQPVPRLFRRLADFGERVAGAFFDRGKSPVVPDCSKRSDDPDADIAVTVMDMGDELRDGSTVFYPAPRDECRAPDTGVRVVKEGGKGGDGRRIFEFSEGERRFTPY